MNWSHEGVSGRLLQRQVADSESKGGAMRNRTAGSPTMKTLKDFIGVPGDAAIATTCMARI